MASENDASLERLENAVIEILDNFNVHLLETLVCSMKHRLQAVLDIGGWYAKY